ncbi:hypothetical protein [Allochromatium vinosum]|uniref:hypothetical protein n=1 Tax=Allochromatium vinosum TaxID=1049 RepID=UPI0019075643|nr:hypothetical protein [Allochromatium vinosum]MBK1654893.1 hypothetical protein [Allochromatium vinosum]
MLDTDASSNSSAPSSWGLFLWPLLTTLGLFLIAGAMRSTPCWVMPLLVVLMAYPLWLTTRESFLFKRRALLAGAIREEALTRRLLWGGHLGAAILVVPALVLATLLLAMATRLNAWQWGVLLVDALVMTGLYRFFQRRAASQVKPEMLGVAVRGWPLRLANLGLLALAFFVLDFFVIGAPDVRHDSWHAVIEQAFDDERQGFACGWTGWLVGGLGSVDQARWVLAQHFIPTLPAPEVRVAVWAMFLLLLGLLSFVFTQLLLGVLALVEQRSIRAESLTGESALGKTFVLTILVLALLPLSAVLHVRDLDPSTLQLPAPAVLNWIDPCRAQAEKNAEHAGTLNAQIQAREAEIKRRIEPRVARELELLFAPVESAVDDYLDWYFTVAGEYERLAALATGDFVQLMGEKLEAHLFEATDFHRRLGTIDTALREDSLNELANVSQAVHDDLEARIRDNPCASTTMHIEYLGQLERDVWRVAGTTGTTVGAVTAALISKKLVATVVAKVAAKKSVQAAAAMLAKFAAKKGVGVLAAAGGGAAAGAAICAPGGPAAAVCSVVGGIAAGAVTWLAVDKVAIEIDEAVSRDEMRADILSVLAEEKAALQADLIERYSALIAAGADDIRTTTDGVFIPARDGV